MLFPISFDLRISFPTANWQITNGTNSSRNTNRWNDTARLNPSVRPSGSSAHWKQKPHYITARNESLMRCICHYSKTNQDGFPLTCSKMVCKNTAKTIRTIKSGIYSKIRNKTPNERFCNHQVLQNGSLSPNGELG